ncbi:hypothetical protein M3M35_06845 [Fructilactobacillus myrtifloralis]|uniref:Uncharacterized protein n=1 Tax=Fructilactobacillus myrtifloralis TaxID=2940301 RepID=A0ABY5BRI5_9LACO|nr:hypothetical protein [Fructilactobacillus myrtifloralis]USS84999.1 hypothetical protein M3M35_06845 [Fructilactobacillus myrtifloralis]
MLALTEAEVLSESLTEPTPVVLAEVAEADRLAEVDCSFRSDVLKLLLVEALRD